MLAGILLALCITMPRLIYVGDAVSIQAASICWLSTGDMSVPASYAQGFGERGQYFFENSRNGKWYSKYGILNTFLYVPPLTVERLLSGQLPFYEQLSPQQYRLRCLLLNANNLLLAAALAAYLYRTACLFVSRAGQAVIFTVATLFCTFLWNYVRAQTGEVFQVTFFTAAFYHLVQVHRRSPSTLGDRGVRTHALLVVLFTGLLVLTKVIFLLLVPLLACALLRAGYPWPKNQSWRRAVVGVVREHWRSFGAVVLLPWAGFCGILLLDQWHRFGSPLETGYGQWEPLAKVVTWDLREGIMGFLFDPRKSIFLHVPLVIFAAFMAVSFARRFRFEAAVAGTTLAVFLIANSCLTIWRGDWSYGPRYLVFVLPVCSLPALSLARSWRRLAGCRAIIAGIAAVVLLWSASRQLFVNSVEWFTPFRAQAVLSRLEDPHVRSYFARPYWSVNRDLLALQSGKGPFPPLESVRSRLTPKGYAALRDELKGLPVGNWFWLSAKAPVAANNSGRLLGPDREQGAKP